MDPATLRTFLALLSKYPVVVVGDEPCFMVGTVDGPGGPMGQRLIPITWLLVQEKPQPRRPRKPNPVNQLELDFTSRQAPPQADG